MTSQYGKVFLKIFASLSYIMSLYLKDHCMTGPEFLIEVKESSPGRRIKLSNRTRALNNDE